MTSPRRSILMVVALVSAASCGGDRAEAPEAPATLKVSAEQFRSLGWLEGDWRGEMPSGEPFYERYRFADGTTLRSYTLPDSTGTAPTDSSAIMLRGDSVTTGSEGSLYTLTELRDGWVRFDPRRGAANSFTWERTGPDAWTATLSSPATPERSARQVVYRMTRMR